VALDEKPHDWLVAAKDGLVEWRRWPHSWRSPPWCGRSPRRSWFSPPVRDG